MKHFPRFSMLGVVLAGWLVVALNLGRVAGAEPAKSPGIEKLPPEQVAFFEKNIRPVLIKECYSCHSATAPKLRGGLKLDTRDNLRKGGDNGPALIPGDPKKSLLLQALRHQADNLKMPPKKKLADETVADFEKWIAIGTPDPRRPSCRRQGCNRHRQGP